MTRRSLSKSLTDDLLARAHAANEQVLARYPGDIAEGQPVHTVYGGAHLFRSDTPAKLGKLALRALDTYGGRPAQLARVLGLSCEGKAADTLFERVRSKLASDPVEDFRIDFEDGYGHRSDAEEDDHAAAAAREAARAAREGTLPEFYGIRPKSLSSAPLARRALRTLDIFVTTLADELAGEPGDSLPGQFIVTLPKITHTDQISTLDLALSALEQEVGLDAGSIPIELMIETTQAIIGPDGRSALPGLLEAAAGRCIGAHFGTYDYTASCGISAAHQDPTHPACDFARHMMQVAYGGTGIFLSDGATNILPVERHKAKAKGGRPLSTQEQAENRTGVHSAWKLHVQHVKRSLMHGFYQGWDLHPAQLPTRYAAVYDFFLAAIESASQRLANFVRVAAKATLSGEVFDDAATGQGLLNFFIRGINCGAITESEAMATGLTLEELRGKSFLDIVESRRAEAASAAVDVSSAIEEMEALEVIDSIDALESLDSSDPAATPTALDDGAAADTDADYEAMDVSDAIDALHETDEIAMLGEADVIHEVSAVHEVGALDVLDAIDALEAEAVDASGEIDANDG